MSQAGWPRFMLRLPPDLKRWVDAQAKHNGASINSEIIRSVRERMDRAAPREATNEKSDDGQSLAAPVVAPETHQQPARTEDERT
ncbi:MAG: Arc family DNA-binding protein [Pseudomonadota bacterium]